MPEIKSPLLRWHMMTHLARRTPLSKKTYFFMSRGEILIDPDSAHSKRRTDQKL